MGRQSAIGDLVGKAKAAKRKKRAVGIAAGARGKSPAEAFLAQFAQRRAEPEAEQAPYENVTRERIQQRMGRNPGQGGGGILARLFGMAR